MAAPVLDFKADYDPADQNKIVLTDLTVFDADTPFLSRSWTVTKSDGTIEEVNPVVPSDTTASFFIDKDYALVIQLNINKVGNSPGYNKSKNVLASKGLYKAVYELRKQLIANSERRSKADIDQLIFHITMADECHEGAKNLIAIDPLAAQKELDGGNNFVLRCKDHIAWI